MTIRMHVWRRVYGDVCIQHVRTWLAGVGEIHAAGCGVGVSVCIRVCVKSGKHTRACDCVCGRVFVMCVLVWLMCRCVSHVCMHV